MKYPPVVLCVWDGFGLASVGPGNAILSADMPVFDRLCRSQLYTTLAASGTAVGLAVGAVGNSEVGHLTIGAGSVVPSLQQLVHHNMVTGEFANNTTLHELAGACLLRKGRVHVVGLLSDGGVHSHFEQIAAVAAFFVRITGAPVYLHAILDGRDTPTGTAGRFVTEALSWPGVVLASIQGRFYGMDRDGNSERIAAGLAAIIGFGPMVADPLAAIAARSGSEEFFSPCTIASFPGIQADDVLFFANTRADRMRQLVAAAAGYAHRASLAEYDTRLTAEGVMPIYRPPTPLTTLLNEVANQRPDWRMGCVAETEKYAHITYFFDGRSEARRSEVTYCLIPSDKQKSYAVASAMQAAKITDQICAWLDDKSLVVANFANADMVGHSGDFEATVKACEELDRQLARLYQEVVLARGGILMVTSDHGNAECMRTPAGVAVTSHTANPVPLLIVGANGALRAGDFGLSVVAPTVLQLLGLQVPVGMERGLLLFSESLGQGAAVS